MLIDVDSAARYVLGRRTAEGGICFYRTPQWAVEEPNAPDTLAALESLRLLDIAAPAPELTGRWLRGLPSVDGRYQTLTIGWAALRALDLLGLVADFSPRDWLTGWVPVVLDGERTGGWHGALVSALRLLELRRLLGLELNERERTALARLLAVAADGSGGRRARPGPDLMTTGVAVRLIALGGLPQGGEIGTVEFLHSCEDPVLGLRLAPTTAMTSVSALRGGLSIALALNAPLRYPQAVGRSIARLQHPNGGLSARDRAIPTLHDTWLALEAACLLKRLQNEPR